MLILFFIFFVQALSLFEANAADTTIKGTTADSSAASLEVTNSANTSLLYVRNDGKVGIGETSPTQKLVVSGNITVGSDSSTNDDYIYFDTGTSKYLAWDDDPGEFDLSDDLNITGWAAIGNTSVATDAILKVQDTITSTGNMYGASFAPIFSPSSSSTATYWGVNNGPWIGNTNFGQATVIGSYNCVGVVGATVGSATLDTYGLQAFGFGKYAANVTTEYSTGILCGSSTDWGGGGTYTVGTGYGIYISDAAATTTTQYGIYMEDINQATTDYGLYIAGADTAAIVAMDRVGIGDATPDAMLDVEDSVAGYTAVISNTNTGNDVDCLYLFITGDGSLGSTNTYIQFANGSDLTAGYVYATNNNGVTYGTTGGDYAEYFYTNDTDLKPGEIVSIDTNLKNSVQRSNKPADKNVIGVISDNSGFVGNFPIEADDPASVDQHSKIVSMVGQVLTLVSIENGPIKIGDYLTSSSLPGYAMKATKAGQTIGVALENYDGKDANSAGKIMVYVNPGYRLQDTDNLKEADKSSDDAYKIRHHDPETGEWIFYSKNNKTGQVKRVNMEKLVKAVERLTGEQFLFETVEAVSN
jgi:archaellum component FlaG (FlaF/FlaG flagellin family)